MWPILFKIGPLTIYSLGFLLALGFLVMLFAIWKETRVRGLPEEKILDVTFLSLLVGLVLSRLLYAASDWSLFAADWGRLFLVGKYPGWSFQGALAGIILTAALSAKASELAVLEVLDIFSLAFSIGVVSVFFGCFLDACLPGLPLAPSWLVVFGLVTAVCLWLLNRGLQNSVSLAKFQRRFGMIFLCYLIFQSVSFLMLSVVASRTANRIELGVLGVALAAFSLRYREIFAIWFNFLKQSCHKLLSIWKKDGVKSSTGLPS